MLDALGVSRDAEQVYRLLLNNPQLDIAGLATESLLSESEVRQALDALAELALVRPSRQSPQQWRPVAPQRVIQMLHRKKEETLQQLRYNLDTGLAALRDFSTELPDQPDLEDQQDAERIVGIDAVQGQMEEIAHSATSLCMSIVPGGPVPAAALTAARELDSELFNRGVTQQVLYMDSARADKATMDYGHWMLECGAEVRTAATLPLRLMIVDRSAAMLPLDIDDLTAGAMIVKSSGIVHALVALFELAWAKATPVDAALPRHPTTGLSSLDRELLLMLATGMTDAAAAKRLGVSLRTERRRMNGLMQMLGANSRFEAGIKANQRGWFDDEVPGGLPKQAEPEESAGGLEAIDEAEPLE